MLPFIEYLGIILFFFADVVGRIEVVHAPDFVHVQSKIVDFWVDGLARAANPKPKLLL